LTGSASYVLRNNATANNEQPHWRWCAKCEALAYWDGSRQPGPCKAGGTHDHSRSGDYSIPYAYSANLGFLAHETGHGFGLDHASGTSRSGDFCNDSRPGAYGDWTDIMSFANTAQFVVPLYSPAGAGLSTPTLIKMGWTGPAEVKTLVAPAAPQTVTLVPVHGGGAGIRAVQAIVPAQGWIYTAELRAPMSWDQGVGSARVAVHALRTLYTAGQDNWRWWHNCEGMIYAGQTLCPAGGVHDGSGSADYGVALNVSGSNWEPGWR
jgi:hypothetical protein